MICVSIVSLKEALRLIVDLCRSLLLIQSWYIEGRGERSTVALWDLWIETVGLGEVGPPNMDDF